MALESRAEITRLLGSWAAGDPEASERVMSLVYEELRRLAASAMRFEGDGHTLQPTALVHDVYLRLAGSDIPWQDRTHFFAVAARAMRRVLVDHARAKRRHKRGAGAVRVTLEEAQAATFGSGEVQSGEVAREDMLDLDAALERLVALDPRKAQVVELHFFAGLSYEEIALYLGVSRPTVQRDLRMARAWLYKELHERLGGDAESSDEPS